MGYFHNSLPVLRVKGNNIGFSVRVEGRIKIIEARITRGKGGGEGELQWELVMP
jgi:hypothetical protein